MKALRALLPTLAGLVLLAGCGDQLPSDIPDPITAEGYADSGWAAYADGDFDQAMEYFQAAIEADVSYPGGYLGAGWTAINRSDYWVVADNYFYMALQLDAGVAPMARLEGNAVQDTMWTVFVCVDPDLPPEVLDPILALTADSGAAWVGAQIHDIVAADGNDAIPYRKDFDGFVASMLFVDNGTAFTRAYVDSITYDVVNDISSVFLTAPAESIVVPGPDIWTWLSVDNSCTWDYATYTPGAMSQISFDALVGWALLQDARGGNGDRVLGSGCIFALSEAEDDYSFGAGDPAREGLVAVNDVSAKGVAASLAFGGGAYPFAWFICKSEGYGLGLDPTRDSFIPELMQIIEDMLNFEG